MSHHDDPAPLDAPGSAQHTDHAIRRRGRVFGFAYDAGIRVTELLDPQSGSDRPPVLPGPRRLALPAPPESTEVSVLEGIARWEWEGGR